MKEQQIAITYKVYNRSAELPEEDRELLQHARKTADKAYAPYSEFCVGAAAWVRSKNSSEPPQLVTGTNQENASYPVGICAERVLLAAISSAIPNAEVLSIAISYKNKRKDKKNGKPVKSDHPAFPCGMCRQSLHEQEQRQKKTFRLILAGQTGEVLVIANASDLLPLSFKEDLTAKK